MKKDAFYVYSHCYSLHHSLWRVLELDILSKLEYPSPVLDLACGDGFFARQLFSLIDAQGCPEKNRIVIALDIDFSSLHIAQEIGLYRLVINSDGQYIPLHTNSINTVLANSVMEHIVDIDSVLKEVSRILKRDGRFIFTIPNDRFSDYLFFSYLLKLLGLERLSKRYASYINYLLRHRHLDSLDVWRWRLDKVGLKIEDVDYYLPRQAVFLWDLTFIFGLWSDLQYRYLGRRILLPKKWGFLDMDIVNRYLRRDGNKDGAAIMVLAVKR